MQNALSNKSDQLQFVEHADFDARYALSLSIQERTLVTVGERTRIERILVDHPQLQHIFVLPHPQTLLCPRLMRRAIETNISNEQRLHLFCFYQASHNHDAATLYPLRLPQEALDTPELITLRQTLIESCCANDVDHEDDCPAANAVRSSIRTHTILLSTHEALLRQPAAPLAGTIVIEDAADLQMNLAEYSATVLESSQIRIWLRSTEEREVLSQFEAHLQDWASHHLPEAFYHERLPLKPGQMMLDSDGQDLPE